MRTALLLLLIVLSPLCAAPQSQSQAQSQQSSSKLDSVKVTGTSRFPASQLVAATGLHAGAQITRDDLQKAANALAQLGPFASVNYRFSSDATGGVEVEYQVTDAPEVPVAFDNFPGFTDDELKAAIESANVPFDGEAPKQGAVLDKMSDALAQLIATRGMNFAVSHALVTQPSGDNVQQFHIEGGQIKIASVDFSDALAQSDPGIHQRLGDIVGQPFSRAAVELFEFEQVRPVYLAHAFLQVRFDPPEAKFANGAVAVVAKIDPGPAFAWAGATWSGNTALGVLELDPAIPLHAGEPANGMKIEAGWNAVRDLYARHGFLDVDLKPVPKFDTAASKVTYAVAVTEGPQYHMGKLVLSGLSIDGETRARAAWKIPAGAVFDNSLYEEFLSSGVQQAFAGFPFHYDKIGRFLQKDPAGATVDVMLDFQ